MAKQGAPSHLCPVFQLSVITAARAVSTAHPTGVSQEGAVSQAAETRLRYKRRLVILFDVESQFGSLCWMGLTGSDWLQKGHFIPGNMSRHVTDLASARSFDGFAFLDPEISDWAVPYYLIAEFLCYSDLPPPLPCLKTSL